jgi:hypothetical protein
MPQVFGNRWIAYMGRPGEQLKPGPDFILSVLSGTLNSLGVLVWAGFFLGYMTANTVFAKRSWGLWGIDVSHALVAQVALAAIVTLLK